MRCSAVLKVHRIPYLPGPAVRPAQQTRVRLPSPERATPQMPLVLIPSSPFPATALFISFREIGTLFLALALLSLLAT